MSTDVGLLPEGFVPALVPEIRDDLDDGARSKFGRSLPMGDYTLFGHIHGIVAERLGSLWETEEQIYSSQDPDKATGDGLKVASSLSGTYALAAAKSTAVETLCGDDGFVIAAGTIIGVLSTGKQFSTETDATLEGLDGWVASTSYAEDDRVTNASRCYVCVAGGISAGAGGPTTTDPDILDGGVHWSYLGDGVAAVDVVVTCDETGPIVALAGDISDIITPAGGLTTARNRLDAKLGRDAMSDEEFRILRESELSQPGTGTPPAVRAALLVIDGVTNATVFFNNTDLTDGDGLPPHTTECMVQGGADQDIWDTLWDNVPLGIGTVGAHVGIVVDSEGTDQTLRFTRPTDIDIWIVVTLTKDPKTYAGDTAVKAAIVAWGAAQKTGKDAVSSAIAAQAFLVKGVLDVTSTKIGIAPAPTLSATIPISLRELAAYDSSRIVVVSSDGVP